MNEEGIMEVVPRMVSEDMNKELIRNVSDDEILKAVFELGALNHQSLTVLMVYSIKDIGKLWKTVWLKQLKGFFIRAIC